MSPGHWASECSILVLGPMSNPSWRFRGCLEFLGCSPDMRGVEETGILQVCQPICTKQPQGACFCVVARGVLPQLICHFPCQTPFLRYPMDSLRILPHTPCHMRAERPRTLGPRTPSKTHKMDEARNPSDVRGSPNRPPKGPGHRFGSSCDGKWKGSLDSQDRKGPK